MLTALEVGITYASLPKALMIALLVGLAIAKAVMVAMYFMHLKYERSKLFWSLIPALLFVFFMLTHIWPDALRLEHFRVIHW